MHSIARHGNNGEYGMNGPYYTPPITHSVSDYKQWHQQLEIITTTQLLYYVYARVCCARITNINGTPTLQILAVDIKANYDNSL